MTKMENIDIEAEIITDNQSDSEDIQAVDVSDVVVYARDWTIETIFNQINIGNIDLNPKFQRRNAWNDDKRSKLIESIIMGYPVPEIVLAENPNKKRSFIVIDGKQRLLTLAGFIDNNKYKYWDRPVLKGLKVLKELNKLKYVDLDEKSKREFDNSSLRCTVITNFKDIQILYDIFYRLNSGSESLSTQELRQALNKGEFADVCKMAGRRENLCRPENAGNAGVRLFQRFSAASGRQHADGVAAGKSDSLCFDRPFFADADALRFQMDMVAVDRPHPAAVV